MSSLVLQIAVGHSNDAISNHLPTVLHYVGVGQLDKSSDAFDLFQWYSIFAVPARQWSTEELIGRSTD